jgi:hypothetical protein
MAAIPPQTLTINWGTRSAALVRKYANLSARKSFVLANNIPIIKLGYVDPSDIAQWDTVTPRDIPVVFSAGKETAQATYLPLKAFIRLDFRFDVKIGQHTETGIEFRQLLVNGENFELIASQYSIKDICYKPSPQGPEDNRGDSLSGRRRFTGSCPLVTSQAHTIEINCEFVDVTKLWWKTWAARDQWRWYLSPDLGGRQERLKVLLWTSGTAPMIWFAAVSDAAFTSLEGTATQKRAGADIVMFRPPAGFNSFFYTNDEKGFLDARHTDTTQFHLGRWLLSPLTHSKFKALKAKYPTTTPSSPAQLELLSLRLHPVTDNPIAPSDPIDRIGQNVREAFRLIGVEAALSRTGHADVALLPLGFDGLAGFAGGGYSALTQKDAIEDTLMSVRKTLWIRGAIGYATSTTPSFSRQIWLLGHSAANRSLFASLANNARVINRIISFDATPAKDVLIGIGKTALETAHKIRSGNKLTFSAVIITTPNMWSSKPQYDEIKKTLAETKATMTFLPLDSEWAYYWKHPPTQATNAHLFEVLREWDGKGLNNSKPRGTKGVGNEWLFWHEWAAHGGHVVLNPKTKDVDSIRTFLQDALQTP